MQESVALMVSELATNVLVHAATGFTVTVERRGDYLRIEVRDAGGGAPILRSPPPSEPHGRGLRIVGEFAADWGVDGLDDGPGKSVWFTMCLGEDRAVASGPVGGEARGRDDGDATGIEEGSRTPHAPGRSPQGYENHNESNANRSKWGALVS